MVPRLLLRNESCMMTYYQYSYTYRYAVRKILDCDHLQSRNNHNQGDIDRGRSHLQE